MTKNQSNEGVLAGNFASLGTVTRDMVHARAAEVAVIEGRLPRSITMFDLAQAKRELMSADRFFLTEHNWPAPFGYSAQSHDESNLMKSQIE